MGRVHASWILLLQVACVSGCVSLEHGYRSSDPLEAMLVAGSAAVATVVEPPRTPPAARKPPPDPAPSRSVRPASGPAPAAAAPAPTRVPRAMIEGYVINEESGWGIAHAVVKVTDGLNAPLRVRADADGRFQVPPPLVAGRYTLQVVDDCWEGSGQVELLDGYVARLWVRVVRQQPCVPGRSLFSSRPG
jgi:hypothetical protein